MDDGKHHFTIDQVVRATLLIAFLIGMLWYLSYQARSLISGPSIALMGEPATIQYQQIIPLEGRAENITRLRLNGREIYTDEEGYFNQPLVLENGYTIMTLSADDRYGRTVSLERSFVYTPQTTTNN